MAFAYKLTLKITLLCKSTGPCNQQVSPLRNFEFKIKVLRLWKVTEKSMIYVTTRRMRSVGNRSH
jgi:hypothetical protein